MKSVLKKSGLSLVLPSDKLKYVLLHQILFAIVENLNKRPKCELKVQQLCFMSISIWLIVLYCIVLYCIVLCCIVLYCIVLYCIVLYCIVLYCIVLYCIVL